MDAQPELKSSKDIIVYLANQFPNCFTIEGDAKPLKVGIFQDLVEKLSNNEQFSKTKLRMALRSYTVSWRYLHCLKEGASRVDLDGNCGDVITAAQAEHAQIQLKESKERAKVNKKVVVNRDKPNRQVGEKPKTASKSKNIATKPPVKKTEKISKQLPKVDITKLNINDVVKVILGSKPVSATISSIEKNNVKVKISSGMELTVSIDRILL